jgi:hypothetical protein
MHGSPGWRRRHSSRTSKGRRIGIAAKAVARAVDERKLVLATGLGAEAFRGTGGPRRGALGRVVIAVAVSNAEADNIMAWLGTKRQGLARLSAAVTLPCPAWLATDTRGVIPPRVFYRKSTYLCV